MFTSVHHVDIRFAAPVLKSWKAVAKWKNTKCVERASLCYAKTGWRKDCCVNGTCHSCQVVLPLSSSYEHVRNCPHIPVQCKRCFASFLRREHGKHDGDCEMAHMVCASGANYVRKDREIHMETVCCNKMTEGPFGCGESGWRCVSMLSMLMLFQQLLTSPSPSRRKEGKGFPWCSCYLFFLVRSCINSFLLINNVLIQILTLPSLLLGTMILCIVLHYLNTY